MIIEHSCPPFHVLVKIEARTDRVKLEEVIKRSANSWHKQRLNFFFWTSQEASVVTQKIRDSGYKVTVILRDKGYLVKILVTETYDPIVAQAIGDLENGEGFLPGDYINAYYPTMDEAEKVAKRFRVIGYPASSDIWTEPYV